MEEGVAIGDSILLVVKGLARHLLLRGLQYGRALLGPHQAVHLPVVRGAHTAGTEDGQSGLQPPRRGCSAPGGLMSHGTGHNNGHNGPGP